MNEITFCVEKQLGRDLSSRDAAARLRTELLSKAESRVALDFSNVRTISESFADELFAVLVAEYGDVWFREHVHIRNVSELIRETVLDAVAHRLANEF